ncbi:MAG: alpha-amylase family glycosyl hydrolase [Melioribacter sp.]|nr:alpha-amylase family glycosyl hydrolase [Melioribacter sp.]
MPTSSLLYEINTRVFLKRFSNESKLSDIPEEIWDYFAKNGFEYIWLMGIWNTCKSTIEQYCFEDYLIQSYSKALKDWTKEDVIGSPYSIDDYEVNPEIGNFEMLFNLKSVLNKKGIKLILDLIPNHFSAHSKLIEQSPEMFLSVDKNIYQKDSNTFYRPFEDQEKYFAHGRDPFFPAWQDTVQVNFFSKSTREYFKKVLRNLIKYCDGVRCDMAMLALNNVFQNTWAGVIQKSNIDATNEFWEEIITATKKERSDFVFIAEVYWNLESYLQQLGFDYTYDKTLLDKLKLSPATDIYEHLQSDLEYQKKLVRFIENHDEERALTSLGKEKSKAAAVIISTIPGMHLYFDGQFEGKKIKLPIQLGREPKEQIQTDIKEFYNKLLNIVKSEIFKHGSWKLIQTLPSWIENNTNQNLLAWQLNYKLQNCLVVINYSDITSSCRIKLDTRNYPEVFEIKDVLNEQTYFRSSEEVYYTGLYIELKPYSSHIFFY